jgi:hypothetical protein
MKYKKTLLVVVVVAALTVVVGAGTVGAQSAPDCSQVSYNGDGTESSPYQVGNVDQLQCIESQGLDASYEVVSDIDATATSSWNGGNGFEPIGSGGIGGAFGGTFDGSGNTITGLTINRPDTDTVGMFASILRAKLNDVIIDDANVEGNTTVGILAGSVSFQSDVNRSSTSGTVTGSSEVGGLAGSVEAFVGSSSSTADVSGGVDIGGLVGRSNGGVILNSYARGDVTADEGAAGLVSFSGNFGVVEKSYATGTVPADTNTGGVIGLNLPPLFPDAEAIKDNYWDTESTGQSEASASNNIDADGATGLTTSEMTGSAAESNMQGLDFTDTWKTVSGDYPILSWQSGSGGSDGDDGSSLSSDNPFGDANNEPLGEIQVIQKLVSWSENGQIDGESYGEIQLIQYLVGWNEAGT